MELSKQKQTEAKKHGVTIQYLVMADLMSIGYSEEDAYAVAYPENTAIAVQYSESIKKNIVESAKFRKLLETRRNRVKEGIATPATLDEMELVGTEEVLKEILRSAKQQPIGSKERAELYAKYNDIRKENEQDVAEETDNISFVLPLKCDRCPLLFAYNDFAKENNAQEVRPVEMGRIMTIAHKFIQAARDAE